MIWSKQHPALYQRFRLLLVVKWYGDIFLARFGQIKHYLNTTAWVFLLTMSIPLWPQC